MHTHNGVNSVPESNYGLLVAAVLRTITSTIIFFPDPTMPFRYIVLIFILSLALTHTAGAQNYPDQSYSLRIDSLVANIESNDGLVLSGDGKKFMLQSDRVDGSIIIKPQYSASPFNWGLPSWNGTAPNDSGAFKIQMRFPSGTGWSSWLTVGFWKANIWTTYGSLSSGVSTVDYDNVTFSSYVSSWQFKIIMMRKTAAIASPTISKLSFCVSDTRTTASQNYTTILADKPAQLFIPTTFIYQYSVDATIGGSICSPTSVSMILRSYNITVDPLQFARDTYDPYFGMYGIWPRVVQNASQYGVDGAVTQYRSWSQARDVLAKGGRISMSVGAPLYTGHLIMLAGFNAAGDPIVHDPARSDGYSHVFSKSDLSHSWFDKGGVAYTFYPAGTYTSVWDFADGAQVARNYRLDQNYPNPFNPSTTIRFSVPQKGHVGLTIYNAIGAEVATLLSQEVAGGVHEVVWNAGGLPSGIYFYRLQTGSFVETKRLLLLK
jgi:Peptidase_C39 like family/Secretion system C-terminal sorting domain